jgi:hypothetical protein
VLAPTATQSPAVLGAVIESRWESKPLAFAGKLRPRRRNHRPFWAQVLALNANHFEVMPRVLSAMESLVDLRLGRNGIQTLMRCESRPRTLVHPTPRLPATVAAVDTHGASIRRPLGARRWRPTWTTARR